MTRIWFITGSSRGLGLAITEAALNNGDSVIATARRPKQLASLVKKYGNERVLPVAVDVTDNDQVVQAVKSGHEKFGRIDVVINNAGYANTAAVEDIDVGDFCAQVDANLMGVVYVSKAVLPILRQQKSGHIFQVSSLGGRIGAPGLSAYQCAKWAVGGFSTVLSQEVAPFGIKITVLEPGGIRTDWAGSSMQVPPVSEPYQATVGTFAEYLRKSSGSEISIPSKIADIVIKLLDEKDPPLRLLVGPDAVEYAGKAAKDLRENDEKCHGVDTILDYGRELMEEIKKIRNTKELQQRPLIFIAHSFGGMILAHCLVKAIQTMEEDHPAITSLHRATYGMILFAIPHKGLVMDDIQQMLAGNKSHPREQLLQQISKKSDLLIHQLADFKNLIRDRKVVSFYETEQTRKLVFLPDHVENKVPLHVDHSMVVKFDTRNTAGYRTALDKLRQFSKDAPSVVAARFAQTRPKPQACSTVPFKRDPMLVGREDIIGAIKEGHKAIGHCHERVALTAIDYSYQIRASAPDMWVFWIHASNAARLEQGYQQIAAVAEILGRDDPKTDIFELVYQWLCDARNGRWMIVLDNTDDDGIFFSGNTSDERGPMVRFLPQAAHGSILITSRNGLAARNLVGSDSPVITVQPMNEEESLALLRARFPSHQPGESTEDEKALVEALEFIPLAISQAGSYIANRLPLVTVSGYLQLFRESESNRAHLLQHEGAKDLRRDPSIRNAVITTWQVSFEKIRHDQPAAPDLLALMSMFDRQGIPEYLLREDTDVLQFGDALAALISYSLIHLEIEGKFFDMHRLVQLSTRILLETQQELSLWQEKS
ncbi:hypothetical protein AnigIFM63604_002939 [Aspergillus niger]|uniref:Ketoreductase domain-containing protein n=1 Tax=Aspergillus niger TaxID=5061 RepID=A0A9W6EEC0_ASPNG|nr:hypothetical protein AnigIFM63604_002939 [Aspergillus niger]